MVAHHTVTRFLQKISSGRNGACIVYCENDEGDETEFVIKLTSSECGVQGLVCELIASQLALDLDLRTPAPALLEVTSDFASVVPDPIVAAAMSKSIGWNFGTVKLPGEQGAPPSFISVSADLPLPPEWRQPAGEIFAFDGITENPDRRRSNPNCLRGRNELVMIDHDMAFSFVAGVISWKPVWGGGSLGMLRDHVFFQYLTGATVPQVDFNRLEGAMQAITESQIRSYAQSVPSGWINGQRVASEIVGYLVDLKQNIVPALQAIRGVLR